MGTHLTVVSYKRELDSFFEKIANALDDEAPHKVARCQRAIQLRERVLNGGGLDVSLLDLVGHGLCTSFEHGDDKDFLTSFELGDDKDFLRSDQVPPPPLAQLNAVLPQDAQIRILGCSTGATASGLKMLRDVSQSLRGREVFGTTADLLSSDFDAQGLKVAFAQRWLISSKADQVRPPENRWAPSPSDKDSGSKWVQLLPGYEVAGREAPIAAIDLSLRAHGVQVSFAGANRLVLIADKAEHPPLVLRWRKPEPAPHLGDLLDSLT